MKSGGEMDKRVIHISDHKKFVKRRKPENTGHDFEASGGPYDKETLEKTIRIYPDQDDKLPMYEGIQVSHPIQQPGPIDPELLGLSDAEIGKRQDPTYFEKTLERIKGYIQGITGYTKRKQIEEEVRKVPHF